MSADFGGKPVAGRQGWTVPALVYALSVLFIGGLAQEATYINHDVAWVLYSSQQLLNGAVFGKDVIEPNPPLIWWISEIPAAIASALGTSAIGTFRLFVCLVAATSLLAAERFLEWQKASRARRIGFLVAAAYLFTIAVHRDFGQREHFAVMLILPYILAVAHRMDGRSLSFAEGFAIGACAGLGLAFKPHFGFVPVLLESGLLWKSRSMRVLVRPEAIGGVVAVILCAIAILVLASHWLFDVLPDIQRIYWAFDQPFGSQWTALAIKFALPVLVAAAILSINATSQSVALLLAAAGFAGAAVVQAKYYTYHLYPVFALLVLAVAVGFPRRLGSWRLLLPASLAIMLVQNLSESAQTLVNRSNRGALGENIASVVAFVVGNTAKDGSFLAVSTHPYPGFPTALYADRRWASTTNSQFYLPAVVRLRQSRETAEPALLAFAEGKARAAVLDDLARKPDVVLIDQRSNRHAIGRAQFDFLEFYLEDPRFRAAWIGYRRAEQAPRGFAAYVRVRN